MPRALLVFGLAGRARDSLLTKNVASAAGVQLALFCSGVLGARLLGPEGRGYAAILIAVPSALAQLGAIGLPLAATYYLSSRRIGGRALVRLLRGPVAMQLTATFTVNAAVILGYTGISDAPILAAALISLWQAPMLVLNEYGFALMLGARQHGAVSIYRLAGPGSYAVLLGILAVAGAGTLTLVTCATTFSTTLSAALALRRGLRVSGKLTAIETSGDEVQPREARRELFAFGRQGYVGYLSPVDSFRLDQIVVGFLLSPQALGLYVVAASFTNFGRFVAYNIGMSASPEIARQHDAVAQHAAIRRTLALAVILLTVLTAALAVAVVLIIPTLFGSAFRDAVITAEILLVAGWLLALKRVFVDVMRGAGQPLVGARPEIVNLMVFLVLCAPLGEWLGRNGVAIALVIAAACGSLVLLTRVRVVIAAVR